MRITRMLVAVTALAIAGALSEGCRREKAVAATAPEVRVELYKDGLPRDFFESGADRCSAQIIAYRSVVWISTERVAVAFNTSPNCRKTPAEPVKGSARILVFDVQGVLKAVRDLPYLADGYGELVADGDVRSGPNGTLVFGVQSVDLDATGAHESKSGVRLLDAALKDVSSMEGVLEQTTFVGHALVFQKGFTLRGPRTYSVNGGVPLAEITQRTIDWPEGTMDRRVEEGGFAYMLCEQELQAGTYEATNVVVSGANRRCALNVIPDHDAPWDVHLHNNETAALLGTLADGTVIGQTSERGSTTGRLVRWRKDGSTEELPWLPSTYGGEVQSGTADMSTYAVVSVKQDGWVCRETGWRCSDGGRWFVFDQRSPEPIVNRPLANNARAALSPDGRRYATFESGQLRIYAVSRPR